MDRENAYVMLLPWRTCHIHSDMPSVHSGTRHSARRGSIVLSSLESKHDDTEEAVPVQKETTPPLAQAPEPLHNVSFANTAHAMAAGLHWVGWRAFLTLAIWLVGISALLQLLLRLTGLWQNGLWLEWTNVLWLSAAAVGLFVIVDLYSDLDRTSRVDEQFSMKACLQRLRSVYRSHLAVGLRLVVPPIVSKTIWVVLVLVSMIPGVGETAFALLWPLRILAAIATVALLVRAWCFALVIPLVASQEGLEPAQAIARTQQLFLRNLFQLIEAAFWGGVAVALVLLAVNSAVQQDVVVAQATRGESAIGLYTAAPLIFRSLTEVPGIDTPFFSTDSEFGWWQTLLSILLSMLHAILFILVYVLILTLVVQPVDNLIRWIRTQEVQTTIRNENEASS